MTQSDPDAGSVSGGRRRGLGRRGWRRILWWSGLVILSGVYLLVQYVEDGFGWPFWMVGPVVISVARLILIGTTAGILAWAGCFWLWVRYPPPERKRWRDKVVRVGTVTVVVILALVSLALDGTMALLETSDAFQPIHVLAPASPGGCRLVLWREPDDGYGQDTYGFLKVPGSARLRKVPGVVWLNPDNFSVRWRLTWAGGRARLTVWGTDHPSQAWNGLVTPVVCPAR